MKRFFFHLAALPLLLCVFMVFSCKPAGTDDPDAAPTKGLRFRCFTLNGGLQEAVNVGKEVVFPALFGYGKTTRVVFYVTEADDGIPLQDDVESHYTVVSKDADSGVLDMEEQDLYVEPLGGKVCGQYVFRFLKPGTATVTLKYDDGEGKALEKTVKVTLENSPHELAVRWGVGNSHFVASIPYEEPIDLSAYGSGPWTLWLKVYDNSLAKDLRDGTFSFDPDNDDPYSNAVIEGSMESPVASYPDMEVFHIKVTTRGHTGMGIRYRGEFGEFHQTVHFYSQLQLELAESPDAGSYFTADKLKIKLSSGAKSLYIRNPARGKSQDINPSALKLSDGKASVAELKLSDDEKALVFTPKAVGTTTWKISYNYYETTLERSIEVTVE